MPDLPSASYEPPTLPSVIKLSGGRSYFSNAPSSLADWLTANGWRLYGPKAGNEMCRLWRSDALILVYLSGSIVAAGKRAEIAHMALGDLLETPPGHQLELWSESEVTA